MKKSLIAVAVAGLFAAPVAMAEVTLSGAINLGIEASSSTAGTAPGGQSLSRTALNANYSHVDLESVDDIGGGNKIIFHYQLVVQPQTASGTANDFNRNSYLGVMGSWGAFKMGTNENVYERMMYTADPLDGAVGPGGNLMILGTPGAATAFDQGQAGCGPGGTGAGCIGFYRRSDQTIWYESPNFGGLSFEVDYTLSAFKTNSFNPTILSLGGKWQPEGAPFYVDAAYEIHDDMFGLNFVNGPGTATGSQDTGMQIGGGFSIAGFDLGLRYEILEYTADGIAPGGVDNYKRTAYLASVKYNMASGYIGGQIGIAEDGKTNLGDATDTGATMIGVGYFHNLSKQSQLQFIYGMTTNKDNANYLQAGGTNAVNGADHTVFHVGLKHTF